jgi:hypothetical protein
MKINSIYKVSLITIVMIFTSCVKFEEDVTKTSRTLDTYYQNEGDADSGIIGLYASLRYMYANQFIVMSSIGTNATKSGSNDDNYDKIATDNDLSRMYSNSYRVIYNANLFLSKIDDIKFESENEDENLTKKNRLKGEAKFMRALAYFNLTQFFGAIPLTTNPEEKTYEESLLTNGIDKESKIAHIEKVYNLIVEDLTFAKENLFSSFYSTTTDKYNQDNISRATKGAATALLSKVYLTMASWPLEKKEYYQNAKDEAELVINSGEYTLLNDYASIFDVDNENNSEIIFNVENISVTDQGIDWGGWQNNSGIEDAYGYGRIRVQPSFYKNSIRSEYITLLNEEEEFYYFEENDPRRQYVIADYTDIKDEDEDGDNNPLTETVTIREVDDFNPNVITARTLNASVYNNRQQTKLNDIQTWKFRMKNEPLNRNTTDINVVVLRYADILLTHAEASNELGDTGAAMNSLNLVRERARLGSPSIDIEINTPANPVETYYTKTQEVCVKERKGVCKEYETIKVIIPRCPKDIIDEIENNPFKEIGASVVPANVIGKSKEQLREIIFFDRLKELMLEGWDHFDLVRQSDSDFLKYMSIPRSTASGDDEDKIEIIYNYLDEDSSTTDDMCDIDEDGDRIGQPIEIWKISNNPVDDNDGEYKEKTNATIKQETFSFSQVHGSVQSVELKDKWYAIPQVGLDYTSNLTQNPGHF